MRVEATVSQKPPSMYTQHKQSQNRAQGRMVQCMRKHQQPVKMWEKESKQKIKKKKIKAVNKQTSLIHSNRCQHKVKDYYEK